MTKNSRPAPGSSPAPSESWDDDADADAARRSATIGAAQSLTAGQLDGLDPIDEELHLDEASRRAELTNMQTTHETENGLDPISGTPNPGVTLAQAAAHTQPGDEGSDMSGRKPMADPLAAVGKDALESARKALSQAVAQDKASKDGHLSPGWRNAQQLKVPKATLDALVAAGKIEKGTAPGMAHMPDTGTIYRLKQS